MVMNKDQPGILLYDYNEQDARQLKISIEEILSSDIIIKSASKRKKQTVDSILQEQTKLFYQDDEPKILLFFGMNDKQIHQVLGSFPEQINRPIFCGLTPSNIHWPFHELIQHLIAEQEMMKKKNSTS